jgi:hypothetical protein
VRGDTLKFFRKRSESQKKDAIPHWNREKIEYFVGKALEIGAKKHGMTLGCNVKSRRHLAQMKHIYNGFSTLTVNIVENDGYRLYADYVQIEVVFDDSYGDSMAELRTSAGSFMLEFRDEPPPPNCNPGYMTFWK